jgi:hypothetical protein
LATIHAIATVSGAILALLDRARRDDFKGAKLSVHKTSDLATPQPEGITLCLYRVNPNQTLRNPLPAAAATSRRTAPPLPVDLHYMVTAWAPTAERQQVLLAWAMRTLEDSPVLSAESLNRSAPVPAVFRELEAVELAREPASMEETARIWEMIRAPLQPSVNYVARTVLLDPAGEGNPPALTRAEPRPPPRSR